MEVTSYTGHNVSKAGQVASTADIAVVIAAATSKEGDDRTSLYLDHGADELISAVAGIRPTVVLMQTPGAVLTPWRSRAAAVANLFLGGEQTGHAWAEFLFGDVPPTGKLPISFPAANSLTVQPGTGAQVRYDEDLLTSYRSPEVKAAFPFGHGLSYTSFHISRPQLSTNGCTAIVCLRLSVKNSGKHPGAEVVQAYLQFPATAQEPQLVLRDFSRTRILRPGEQQEVLLSLNERQLSAYHTGIGWKPVYDTKVHIGTSSADIRHVVAISLIDAMLSFF